MRYNVFAGTDVLDQGLICEILKSAYFRPRSVRLVAFDNEKKTAIGFLRLKENTSKFFLIEDLFVDPNYRNLGVATRLLNYAIAVAKEKKKKKVHLNIIRDNTNAINLYKKCGFKEIGCTIMGQRYGSGSNGFRAIKRFLIGHGFLTKITLGKNCRLVELKTNSKENRKTLFHIYQRCVDQAWIDFFELDADSLINGPRHVWQPPFFRNVLVNDQFNSCILIFNYPFSYRAEVELCSTSSTAIPSIFDDLVKTLANRGIPFAQITSLNLNNTVSNLFKEKGMMIFQKITMGKTLEGDP